MRSPDFTATSALLPPVYQEQAASFAQVDAYLGLADELARAQVEALEDLLAVTGPDAALRWPTHLPLTAGAQALVADLTATYDEVARWLSFTVPSTWPVGRRGWWPAVTSSPRPPGCGGGEARHEGSSTGSPSTTGYP